MTQRVSRAIVERKAGNALLLSYALMGRIFYATTYSQLLEPPPGGYGSHYSMSPAQPTLGVSIQPVGLPKTPRPANQKPSW